LKPCRAVACATLFISSAWASGDASETGFGLVEVAPGVHVHRGGHASVEAPGREDIANLSLIVGAQCAAVVDTGGSLRIGRAFARAVREVTELPVCWVINTHVHFDHLLGNAAFSAAGTEFVGHRALAEAVALNRAFFAENFADELAGGGSADDTVVAPSLLVDDTLELELGGRKLVLKAHPVAHSGQDLSVFDPQTGTLFLGDLLFVERTPSLDGSLLGWLRVLEELPGSGVERVVPGHGPASVEGGPEIAREVEYLDRLRDDIREAIAEGALPEDVTHRVAAGEESRWLLFEEVHPRNVVRAWQELEWE
jgi:quinoprotein relay system zinc metallohydrolase 2